MYRVVCPAPVVHRTSNGIRFFFYEVTASRFLYISQSTANLPEVLLTNPWMLFVIGHIILSSPSLHSIKTVHVKWKRPRGNKTVFPKVTESSPSPTPDQRYDKTRWAEQVRRWCPFGNWTAESIFVLFTVKSILYDEHSESKMYKASYL